MALEDKVPKIPTVSIDTLTSYVESMMDYSSTDPHRSFHMNEYLIGLSKKNPLLIKLVTERVALIETRFDELGLDPELRDSLVLETKWQVFNAVADVYGLIESQMEADYLDNMFKTSN